MNPRETALARSRAYQLFSTLFLHGLTEDLVPIVRELPELSIHIADTLDPEVQAAQHYQLFGMNVFPYEAIFLDTEGLLGGQITEGVSLFFQECGFPGYADENADHIGVELGLLAFLCGAESDAHADGVPHEAHRMRQFQRRFLDEHILRWMPTLTRALEQQGQGFYVVLAQITLALVCDHRAALGSDVLDSSSFVLPDVPDLLAEEKTSLKDIAGYLLTPIYSGFYLSRDDIGRLGDTYRIPRGFGQRQQMLTNLMRTAADYDALDDIFAALVDLVQGWQSFYASLDAQDSVSLIWSERTAQTLSVLAQIRSAAKEQRINTDQLSSESM